VSIDAIGQKQDGLGGTMTSVAGAVANLSLHLTGTKEIVFG